MYVLADSYTEEDTEIEYQTRYVHTEYRPPSVARICWGGVGLDFCPKLRVNKDVNRCIYGCNISYATLIV